MLTQSLFVGLLALKARQYFRNQHTPWLWRLYEDGIFAFFVILVSTMVNAILMFFAPDPLHSSLIMYKFWAIIMRPDYTPYRFQRTIYSVLCTRVIFGIRGAYLPENQSTKSTSGVLSTYVAHPLFTQLSEEWCARPNSSISEIAEDDFLTGERMTRRSYVDISDLPVHCERISYF
ncbi:hypothetical protein BD410DRAFT_533567 [Rickenella mellea]|uniref:Uncharacterized protein n=1 Tax=Rickenella mellea TaxID=50990 RepID=A0A4Y7PS15_9AGAM|nr:hypothetical protein BD410DRAFT_533567 [Rickenella mellea]